MDIKLAHNKYPEHQLLSEFKKGLNNQVGLNRVVSGSNGSHRLSKWRNQKSPIVTYAMWLFRYSPGTLIKLSIAFIFSASSWNMSSPTKCKARKIFKCQAGVYNILIGPCCQTIPEFHLLAHSLNQMTFFPKLIYTNVMK